MDDGGDELHFLGHALRELFHLLVFPLQEVETLQPFIHTGLGIVFRHAAQTGQIDNLVLDLHFLVQTAFFGQIAYFHDVAVGHRTSVEQHLAAVGVGDAVDDSYQRCLAGAVGAQQSVDAAVINRDGYVIHAPVLSVLLADFASFYKSHLGS